MAKRRSFSDQFKAKVALGAFAPHPASEKFEIIRLVEQSHLPAKRTLNMLGTVPSVMVDLLL